MYVTYAKILACEHEMNCEKFIGKYVSVPESLFNLLYAVFQPAIFLKKRLLDRCFPVATVQMFICSGFVGTQNYLLAFLVKFIEKKKYYQICAKIFYL